MRYLGKLTAILSMRADLEHVYVSELLIFIKEFIHCEMSSWSKLTVLNSCEIIWAKKGLFSYYILQKISVMEMIIRSAKQLFKIHMQSGEFMIIS